jgi:hypothetical protein
MIIEEGLMGTTTVCDGKQLLHFLPATNRYVEDAGRSADRLSRAG